MPVAPLPVPLVRRVLAWREQPAAAVLVVPAVPVQRLVRVPGPAVQAPVARVPVPYRRPSPPPAIRLFQLPVPMKCVSYFPQIDEM